MKKDEMYKESALSLYDVFVHFIHFQFGGTKQQRTPTTNSLENIAHLMQQPKDSERLVCALMREYLSNYYEPNTEIKFLEQSRGILQ